VQVFGRAGERLSHLVPLGLGFLFGTALGALAYVWLGLWLPRADS